MQDIKISSASIQNSEPTILLVREGRSPGLHPHECGQLGDTIVLPVKKKQKNKDNNKKLILTSRQNRLFSILLLGMNLHLSVVKRICE